MIIDEDYGVKIVISNFNGNYLAIIEPFKEGCPPVELLCDSLDEAIDRTKLIIQNYIFGDKKEKRLFANISYKDKYETSLQKGIKIEMRKNYPRDFAREIAKDNIKHYPGYYESLENLQNNMEMIS